MRRPLLIRALHWLKDNNSLYGDIQIEENDNMDVEICHQQEPGELLNEEETSIIRRNLQVQNNKVANVINSGPPLH